MNKRGSGIEKSAFNSVSIETIFNVSGIRTAMHTKITLRLPGLLNSFYNLQLPTFRPSGA